MKKYNILVTGVGAIIGYGVIKSLRNSGIECCIVGMDIYNDAVGQRWCDKFIQALYACDNNYISFLKNVIKENSIDLVFFGTEQEIYRCAEAKKELGEGYHKLVINETSLLAMSRDKWKTRETLINNNLGKYAIPSVIQGEYEDIANQWGKEFLLKPRSSYASKGIHVVNNKKDFDFYREKMGHGFMAQQLVGDNNHEYTVGVFGLGDGTFSSMIQLKRKLSQEGATAKAIVVNEEKLERAVTDMCKVLCPIGPTNFQFRIQDSEVYLLEVNPRISSSTSIRTAFGYNESLMCIEYFINGKVIYPTVKKGMATRFIDEVINYCE